MHLSNIYLTSMPRPSMSPENPMAIPVDSALKQQSTQVDGYDFFDFGCSTGANIVFTNSVLPGLRALGIDIDPAKIKSALGNGHDARIFDILKLPEEKLVSFVTMAHFLEHLGSVGDARKMIAKAISVSRDFVFIRQPWFDADGALLQVGCKFYWSDWKGHRNKMTSLDFYSILKSEHAQGRIQGFSIHGRGPVRKSLHPAILPLDAPINQHHYDETLHGAKTTLAFPFIAFREIVVLIDIGDGRAVDAMLEKLGPLQLIVRSP
jgi:hypothetical protein